VNRLPCVASLRKLKIPVYYKVSPDRCQTVSLFGASSYARGSFEASIHHLYRLYLFLDKNLTVIFNVQMMKFFTAFFYFFFFRSLHPGIALR